MDDLSAPADLESTREHLQSKQQQIQERIQSLKTTDPILEDGIVEAMELGTASWQAEAHEHNQAMISGLQEMSKDIQKTLKKISAGTYGVCERCHKNIEPARLLAFPTAEFCISCK